MNKNNALATKQFAAMKIAAVRRLYRRIRNKKEDAASDAISGDTHNALRFLRPATLFGVFFPNSPRYRRIRVLSGLHAPRCFSSLMRTGNPFWTASE